MKKIISIVLVLIIGMKIQAQESFEIIVEPVEIDQLGGVQSFVFGKSDGKWLILGGRVDGLHRRQPWASFDQAGFNDQLLVVDPETSELWNLPLDELSVEIYDKLSSSNMEFFQDGDLLYCVGGYGYSSSADDHITFPNLAILQVSNVIEGIINDEDISEFIYLYEDEYFAVTGGSLDKIYDTFYLSGGQKFDGVYNPMNNPTFVQEYSNSIKKFSVEGDFPDFIFSFQETIEDEEQLHRRDLNVIPQILPNNEEGLIMFSGVFQEDDDIPFLNAVVIDSTGYNPTDDFSQYYNHYHCAHLSMKDSESGLMHNLFFGGIAQYYEDEGELIMDNEVPFVSTIARVTIDESGQLAEYKLPVEMPGYLGASSEFIVSDNIPLYENGVINYTEIEGDTVLLGHIFGGINSSQKNIFWINDGTQSIANEVLFEVYLVKESESFIHEYNAQSNGDFRMHVYPNPSIGHLNIDFDINYLSDVRILLIDSGGKTVVSETLEENLIKIGSNSIYLDLEAVQYGTQFFLLLETDRDKLSQKIIINE